MTSRSLSIWGVISAVGALGSAVLFGIAMGFDPAAGSDLVERIASTSPGDASFIKWGSLADVVGYYLIPAGIIVAARDRIPWPDDTIRDLSTVAGLVYATIGSIGAGVLAAAAPPLIESGPDVRVTLETAARVAEGLWQWVNPIPFTAWAFGMALAFRGRSSLWFAAFTVLAAGGALVWLGRILDIEPLLIVGLALWLGPFPFVIGAVAKWAPARSA